MELGAGYQLLGHGVDAFICCSGRDCTVYNMSFTLGLCAYLCVHFSLLLVFNTAVIAVDRAIDLKV